MPNPLSHFEVMSADAPAARAFYGAVFDWQFDNQTMPPYTLINTGDVTIGAIFPKPAEAPGVCLNVYFKVDDITACLAAVAEHGGKTLVPKTAIPGVGHFAMFTDPEGIPIGIMQPDE